MFHCHKDRWRGGKLSLFKVNRKWNNNLFNKNIKLYRYMDCFLSVKIILPKFRGYKLYIAVRKNKIYLQHCFNKNICLSRWPKKKLLLGSGVSPDTFTQNITPTLIRGKLWLVYPKKSNSSFVGSEVGIDPFTQKSCSLFYLGSITLPTGS